MTASITQKLADYAASKKPLLLFSPETGTIADKVGGHAHPGFLGQDRAGCSAGIDRTGEALSCPSCSGSIERSPDHVPPPPRSHVTLKCTSCGRTARYIAGAA